MLSVARLVSFWRCITMQYNCQKSSNFQGLSHFSRIFGKNDKIPGFFQAGKTVTIFPGAVGTLDHVAILCTGRHTNVISVNLHPFLPLFHARLNSTGGIEFDPPLKLGGNHWDDTQFDKAGIQM